MMMIMMVRRGTVGKRAEWVKTAQRRADATLEISVAAEKGHLLRPRDPNQGAKAQT